MKDSKISSMANRNYRYRGGHIDGIEIRLSGESYHFCKSGENGIRDNVNADVFSYEGNKYMCITQSNAEMTKISIEKYDYRKVVSLMMDNRDNFFCYSYKNNETIIKLVPSLVDVNILF